MRFVRKDTEQVHVTLGGLGLQRGDDRRFAARVLDAIFGGLSSSRLFQAVREERGLAYSVYSFAGQYADTGQVGLYVGTRPDNLVEAMKVVNEELERFREEPATEAELVRARENVKARVVLGMESTGARMHRLGGSLLFDLPLLETDEVMERIDAVTLDDMRSLVDELWAPGGLSAAGIGPDEDAFCAAVEGIAGEERLAAVIRVAVAGAAGRMGSATCDAVEGAEDMELTGRADPTLGTSLADVLADADVLVDFTIPVAGRRQRARGRARGRARRHRHHRLGRRRAARSGGRRARQGLRRRQLRHRRGADDALRRRGLQAHAGAPRSSSTTARRSSTSRQAPPPAPPPRCRATCRSTPCGCRASSPTRT